MDISMSPCIGNSYGIGSAREIKATTKQPQSSTPPPPYSPIDKSITVKFTYHCPHSGEASIFVVRHFIGTGRYEYHNSFSATNEWHDCVLAVGNCSLASEFRKLLISSCEKLQTLLIKPH